MSSFDLEADQPPPTPYPDCHSPSNSSKGPLGGQPRPSFARAHSLDHLTLYQDKQERLTGLGYSSRIASPPKVAFVFDRTLRPCPKEELSIEFEAEGEGNSPTSMQYMSQVGSTYTASTSQHTLPPRLTIDV